jgi:hypothetical protein
MTTTEIHGLVPIEADRKVIKALPYVKPLVKKPTIC